MDEVEKKITSTFSCFENKTFKPNKTISRKDVDFGSFRVGFWMEKGKVHVVFYSQLMAYELVSDPSTILNDVLNQYHEFKRQNDELAKLGFKMHKKDFFSLSLELKKAKYKLTIFRKMLRDTKWLSKNHNIIVIFDSLDHERQCETDDMVFVVREFFKGIPLDQQMIFPKQVRDFIASNAF